MKNLCRAPIEKLCWNSVNMSVIDWKYVSLHWNLLYVIRLTYYFLKLPIASVELRQEVPRISVAKDHLLKLIMHYVYNSECWFMKQMIFTLRRITNPKIFLPKPNFSHRVLRSGILMPTFHLFTGPRGLSRIPTAPSFPTVPNSGRHKSKFPAAYLGQFRFRTSPSVWGGSPPWYSPVCLSNGPRWALEKILCIKLSVIWNPLRHFA